MADVSPYIISPVFLQTYWEIEGSSDVPFTRRWLDNFDCQISTMNNKSVRDTTTKKLVFEMAKLVMRNVRAIRG